MNTVVFAISECLAVVMKFFFSLIGNYGLTIIVFTIFSKVVLLPVSLLTQQNGIKMAKMRPKLDDLKIKFVDDKDKFADAQLDLYKKEKYHPFLGMVPLFVQLFLILGLLGVMYRPISYLVGIDKDTMSTIRDWYQTTTKVEELSNSYELDVVHIVQESVPSIDGVSSETVQKINDFDMHFLGINLSENPSTKSAYQLLAIPFLVFASSLLLCVVQNRISVLQLYAGKFNKIASTVFMVVFTTYLSFIVPNGVGLYWIFGNLFSIPFLCLTNLIYPPKKYINIAEVRQAQKAQEDKERYLKKFAKKEKDDYNRFFSVSNMKLMVYAEGKGFYKYFQPVLDYVRANSDIVIHYVTSDPIDPILEQSDNHFKTYYIARDKYIIPLFLKLDTDICLMTTPDLQKYHIKRSKVRKNIEYIYIGHSMTFLVTLRKGALDNFDTVLCSGPDVVKEIRAWEEHFGLNKKLLVESGYSIFDKLLADFAKLEPKKNDEKMILIAPSWQPDNIIDLCVEDIVDAIKDLPYKIIVRPHPQQVRHKPERFDILSEKYKDCPNVEIQTDFTSTNPIMRADLLITDWSDISFEYAFTTLRPVLFIDTPMKVMNPDYDKIGCESLNVTLRNRIGKSVGYKDMNELVAALKHLLSHKDEYSSTIETIRNQSVFNIGRSREIEGRYLIKRLKD